MRWQIALAPIPDEDDDLPVGLLRATIIVLAMWSIAGCREDAASEDAVAFDAPLTDTATADGADAAIIDGADAAIIDGADAAIIDGADAAIIDGADAAIIDGADAAIIDGAAIDSGADARPVDAPIDANLSGLGQLCTLNEECPAEAPTCLDFGVHAMLGYCTRVCHDDWMATTDNQGTFPAGSFNLPPSDSDLCRASFSGSSGVALCGVATDVRPMIVTLPAPDTTYTMDYTCIITCGSGAACPAGLVANTNVVPSGCVCVPWR